MVPHLEHRHGEPRAVEIDQLRFGVGPDVAGQQHRPGADDGAQHERVVVASPRPAGPRMEGRRVEHRQTPATDVEPSTAPQRRQHRPRRRDELAVTGIAPPGRGPHPIDRDQADDLDQTATVVPVRMGEDDTAQPIDPEGQQRREQDTLSEAGTAPPSTIDEDRVTPVAQQDRLPLPDVEDDHLRLGAGGAAGGTGGGTRRGTRRGAHRTQQIGDQNRRHGQRQKPPASRHRERRGGGQE